MAHSELFQPIKVGTQTLQHRVVLTPMTRIRSTNVPSNPLMAKYYSQRASRPGTLLITEATFIEPQAIVAWKEITDAVHANGSSIFLQLWALGLAPRSVTLREDGFELVGPSPVPINPEKYDTPRVLTVIEIHEYVRAYAQAAKNAVEGGFHGVEDEYGGSVEKRSRLALEVVDAVVEAVGQDRTGFTHFSSSLRTLHPDMAYLHAVQPDVSSRSPEESNDFIRALWSPKPLVTCGGYTRKTAIERADTTGDLIAFGKTFISNPDLSTRLENDIQLGAPDPKTFYTPGEEG
ncbi:hypothetical protein BDZ97DRAFT_1901881 [Flammula alnicola]|nr:hypothetical protein BDZ97DRAFT_1901881 [Flammula alnicola]